MQGDPRCTLQMHLDDATYLGALNGGTVRITSRVGSLEKFF